MSPYWSYKCYPISDGAWYVRRERRVSEESSKLLFEYLDTTRGWCVAHATRFDDEIAAKASLAAMLLRENRKHEEPPKEIKFREWL